MMRLSISNIAWDNERMNEHLVLISDLGLQGLELAPSCVWDEPVKSSETQRRDFRYKLADLELELVGLHSLLYTRPDLQLFGDVKQRQQTVDYLRQLCDLAADLRGRTLVFGSPRNRVLNGMDYKEATDIAIDVFRQVGQHAETLGVVLCLEALSEKETEFMRSTSEAVDMVESVDSNGFGLHLDAKMMVDTNEDIDGTITKLAGRIEHFHISDQELAPPGSSGFDHAAFGNALEKTKYDRFVSIEMRRGFGESTDVVRRAVDYVAERYPVRLRKVYS